MNGPESNEIAGIDLNTMSVTRLTFRDENYVKFKLRQLEETSPQAT